MSLSPHSPPPNLPPNLPPDNGLADGLLANSLSYASLVFANFLWAVVYVLAKLLFEVMDPFTLAIWRFTIAAAAWLLLFVLWKPHHLNWHALKVGFLPGIIGVTIYNLFFFPALNLTLAVHAVVLVPGLGPTMTALISRFVLKKPIEPMQGLGIAISFFGILLLFADSLTLGEGWQMVLLGDLLLISCTICWSSYSLLVNHQLAKGVRPMAITGYATIWGAFFLVVILLPFAPNLGESAALMGIREWGITLWIALGGTVLPFVIWTLGVQRIGAVKASIFLNFLPIWGVIISIILLDEPISLLLPAALVMVVAGVILTQRPNAIKTGLSKIIS